MIFNPFCPNPRDVVAYRLATLGFKIQFARAPLYVLQEMLDDFDAGDRLAACCLSMVTRPPGWEPNEIGEWRKAAYSVGAWCWRQ